MAEGSGLSEAQVDGLLQHLDRASAHGVVAAVWAIQQRRRLWLLDSLLDAS